MADQPRHASAFLISVQAQLVCVDERGAVCSVVTSMALLTGLLTPAPGAAVQAAAPEGGE
jgi:hypothetical protein